MIILKFIKKIQEAISKMDTRTLTGSLFTFSVLAMVLAVAINNNPSPGEPIQIILIFIMFFLGGTVGLVYIVRKEVPALFWNIRGVLAIITGFFMLITGWGLAIVLIARYILGKN